MEEKTTKTKMLVKPIVLKRSKLKIIKICNAISITYNSSCYAEHKFWSFHRKVDNLKTKKKQQKLKIVSNAVFLKK